LNSVYIAANQSFVPVSSSAVQYYGATFVQLFL